MTQSIVCPDGNLLAASSPGGMARHFRVQLFDPTTQTWRMHSAFRFVDQATRCADELRSRGADVRVVQYRLCATAA